ncbi:MAG: hypothetical protein F6K28_59930 [Microcoleus sp. SIO2G3]|nr:hypothetical protein [Microcoleus sp. SIO2G3]
MNSSFCHCELRTANYQLVLALDRIDLEKRVKAVNSTDVLAASEPPIPAIRCIIVAKYAPIHQRVPPATTHYDCFSRSNHVNECQHWLSANLEAAPIAAFTLFTEIA